MMQFHYALLTSLFACLAFNTGEDLYCVHICRSHGLELLPIQENDGFSKIVSSTIRVASKSKNLLKENAPSPLSKKKNNKKKKKRVQCFGVVCDLATPLVSL